MHRHPFDRIPELAGLATYARAAHVGYSVDENVRRLLRFHWIERRLTSILTAHITSEPVWEVKCALSLHQWQSAERAEALRGRIAEMRSPAPRLDTAPDPLLHNFLDELYQSSNTAELLTGTYRVALPALVLAYREHYAHTNPLVDQPTRRLLRTAIEEIDDAVDWGTRALDVVTSEDDARRAADQWTEHLVAYLTAAGGVDGNVDATHAVLPPSRTAQRAEADFHPRRDDRFQGSYNFEFPPHDVYNMPDVPADERNLALVCKRTLEMDVPEMMASFITERDNEPWEFYRDYARQLWDEARHAMMGTVWFEYHAIDWKRDIPLNVGFSLRLNRHATPIERQMMLYSIEQSLMPGETGKRYEYETAVAAGDALSAHFHDYDWADEVLHAQIGRRALKRDGIGGDEARERGEAVNARTWAALEQYRPLAEQRNWWPDFVRRVLRREPSG